MHKNDLFIGMVVINTTLPMEIITLITVVDDYTEDFVNIRYIDLIGLIKGDVIKKVPMEYFLTHWTEDFR
jgi:hypothetical protein